MADQDCAARGGTPVPVDALVRRIIRKRCGGPSTLNDPPRSGYRSMWLICVFDLPVGNPDERRRATRFRKDLLDEGFSMKQWSVYQRYFETRDQAEACADRIGPKTPAMGLVTLYFITDKQFGRARNFQGPNRAEDDEKPDQLALF